MSYTYHWAQVRVCQYVPVVCNYKCIAIYSQLKNKIKCDIPINYKLLHQLSSQFNYKIPCWSHDLTFSL
jgi:hypothetical protein